MVGVPWAATTILVPALQLVHLSQAMTFSSVEKEYCGQLEHTRSDSDLGSLKTYVPAAQTLTSWHSV